MDALRQQLRDIVSAEMPADSAHDLAHLDRVWATVQILAKGEGQGDLKVLLAATYLHDIVNLPKDSPVRGQASTFAAERAGEILRRLGFSQSQIMAVQHAIKAHSFSAGIPPTTFEATILRDADHLDALGAIGIARTFAVAGDLGLRLYDANDPFAERRQLDDRQFSLDHWLAKLLGLGERLITRSARRIASRRIEFMQGFLHQLADEIDAKVPESWLSRD